MTQEPLTTSEAQTWSRIRTIEREIGAHTGITRTSLAIMDTPLTFDTTAARPKKKYTFDVETANQPGVYCYVAEGADAQELLVSLAFYLQWLRQDRRRNNDEGWLL